jgi:hypothetical protein
MRLAGVIGRSDTPDNDEAADGLISLNAMLESWRIERLMVYQIVQNSHTWTASQASRTIGTSGSPNFSAQRPDRVDSAFVRDSNNNDYPLEVLADRTEYDAIVVKSTTSTLPQWLFYDPSYPNGTLYLFPVPSVQVTLKLNTWQTLQSFSTLTTDLALPSGYERAIVFNLAPEIAPEYGTGAKMDPQVPMIAVQSKAAIKTLNQPSMVAQLDPGISSLGTLSSGRWNIYTD